MEASHLAVLTGGMLTATSLFYYLARAKKAASTDEEFERMKTEVRKSHEILHQSQSIWLDHKSELEREITKLKKECQAFRTGYETEFKARAAAVKEYTEKAMEHIDSLPKPKRKKKERNG